MSTDTTAAINNSLQTLDALQACLRVPSIAFTRASAILLGAVLTMAAPVAADTTNKGDQAWVLDKPLTPYTALYTVGNDMLEAGQAEVKLYQTGARDEWQYSLITRPMGIFKLAGKGHVQESATFEIVADEKGSTIHPQRYKFRQDDQTKRAIDATFNWGQRQLYFQRGDKSGTAALTAGTLDRMTMTVAMMGTLTPDFQSLTLEVFDGGRLKQVELINEGRETLKTVLGTVETVKVRTRNAASSTRETITWFAPSINNLPVRIEQIKNGDLVARLSLSEYQPK